MQSSAHYIVEPHDHPISQRHLRITYSSMKHSDMTFMGMMTSPKNAEDVLDKVEILFDQEFLKNHAVMMGKCNGNSRLVWDETLLGAMRAFCWRNQPVLCSPFVLGGANTPASTAAAVAQSNAGRQQGLSGDLQPLLRPPTCVGEVLGGFLHARDVRQWQHRAMAGGRPPSRSTNAP
jgi:trimethylamine:corrinoid methyltransferase-like protein